MPPSADKFISIMIGPQDESAVPTLFARLRAAGNQAVRISQPDVAVMESGFVGNVQPTSEISDSRQIAFRHRVPCNGLGRLAEDLIRPGSSRFFSQTAGSRGNNYSQDGQGRKRVFASHQKRGYRSPERPAGCGRPGEPDHQTIKASSAGPFHGGRQTTSVPCRWPDRYASATGCC